MVRQFDRVIVTDRYGKDHTAIVDTVEQRDGSTFITLSTLGMNGRGPDLGGSARGGIRYSPTPVPLSWRPR